MKAARRKLLPPALVHTHVPLLAEVRGLILSAREGMAQAVNSSLALLYWQVGSRIRREILNVRRPEYGAQIVAALGRQLEQEFGRGFGEKNLPRFFPAKRLSYRCYDNWLDAFPSAKLAVCQPV